MRPNIYLKDVVARCLAERRHFEEVIRQLALRRDGLDRAPDRLPEWRRLRSDVFMHVLSARRTFVDEQNAFLGAIREGRPTSRQCTSETLQACRVLRAILSEVDATILTLIDK